MRILVIAVLVGALGLAPVAACAQSEPHPATHQGAAGESGEAGLGPWLGIAFGMGAGALAFNAVTRAFDPGLPVATSTAAARSFAAGAAYGFQTGLWHGIGILATAAAGGVIGHWLYNK
ncbi:MAG: hypothetical protein GC191_09750 [Azospirillum sp.]|nr:hypothetical protein [Azospirillum sp.]